MKKGFTLIELLVVVLIIGILAAIAVPQYQRAVWKANLHKGIFLVESLYEAQESYFLTHGSYATDIDALDVSIPKNDSCVKTQNNDFSRYKCDFGVIGIYDNFSNLQYQDNKGQYIAYLHVLKDHDVGSFTFEKGKRYCFAWPTRQAVLDVCQNMGGVEVSRPEGSWVKYELP